MIPHYKKIHNKFRYNGIAYGRKDLKEVAYSFVKEGDSFEKSIGDFLLIWLDANDYVLVKTSGTTGAPKTITLKKQSMVNSVIATGDYFDLKPGQSALLCLSSEFIAGKMMLVRAMVLGLQLDSVAPSSSPLYGIKKAYDFSAMVPLQVQNSMSQLHQIQKLIIGGAQVSNSLIEKLQEKETKAFATYGMTETITHIAAKPLNHIRRVTLSEVERSLFKLFPKISVSQDKRNCLIIEAPHLFDGKVVTNDIVKLHSDSEFELLGRYDNVINSGGIKLFPEQIEAKLSKVIQNRFFIASEADDLLGERVVLIMESESSLSNITFDSLDSYETPKAVYAVPVFVETSTGKINRKKSLELAISLS